MLPAGARHYGYSEGGVVWSLRGELHRTDLRARRDTVVARLPATASNGYRVAAVAPDGTVYYSALERRVRRQVMTNFGDR
jgi:hypothetical protein